MDNIDSTKSQFLLSACDCPRAGFLSRKLQNGFTLIYRENTRFFSTFSAALGGEIILFGCAVQVDENLPAPEKMLENVCGTHELLQISRTWAGRWGLISPDGIQRDATGLLPLFYTTDDGGAPIAVSNSLSLLREIYGCAYRMDFAPIAYRKGLSFYPGPETVLVSVRQLMNTQCMVFAGGKMSIAAYQPIVQMRNMEETELLDALNKALITFMRNAAQKFTQIYVPLTAGYDSRTILSAALAAGIPLKSYTCIRSDMSKADKTLPKKMADAAKIAHFRLKRDKTLTKCRRARRADAFDAHTLATCVDRDREYYECNQLAAVNTDDCLVLGGGIWEISRGFYAWRVPKEIAAGQDARAVFQRIPNISSMTYAMLDAYLAYVRQNPFSFPLSFTDRFYYEQRLGCWLSGIESGLELWDFTRLHALNCAHTLSVLINLAAKNTGGTEIARALIRKNAPFLLDFPFNKETILEKFKKASKDKFKRLKRKTREKIHKITGITAHKL